jgi:arginyl-tRNA--protein-N-Asp/Glu arginylyltransferase
LKGMEITYDEICRAEFNLLQSRIEHLFVNIDIGCPYGLPSFATFHQATFAPLNERAMELFLAAGYRRNGNCLYDMHCCDCMACTPIRIHPGKFRLNRNQKRVIEKNKDVQISLLPLAANKENIDLCEKFLQARYPKEDNSASGYYREFFLNTIVESVQLQFRVDDRLVGTSILDIGSNWLNGVYFFFDPDESNRSLGTYNILHLIQICQRLEIGYLYLGYFIKNVSAMSYKGNFNPHYLFIHKKWQQKK